MIRTLNSMRFILILMIVISHSTLPITQGLKDYLGEYAVAIFFVISGFVLSLGKGEKLEEEKTSNRQFFFSRIIKIFPLHLIVLVIIILLDWRLGHLGTWYQTLAQCFLVQCWVPSHHFIATLNGATWFLSDIMFFYLIFKYLYHWGMNYSWAKILPILSIYMVFYIILSLSAHSDYSNGYIYFYPPFRMIDFIFGILLYKSTFINKSRKTIFSNITLWKANLADIVIVMLFVGMYYLSIYTIPNIRCSILYWIPSVITVYYIMYSDTSIGWLTKILHNKQLLWLGGISFEIYLCHGLCFRIIQSIFLKIFGEDIPYLGLQFIISIIFTIVTAWVAKKYIVSPLYNKIYKFIK